MRISEKRVFWIAIFAILAVTCVHSEHFTALTDLNKAIQNTISLADDLELYVEYEEKRLSEMKNLIDGIRKLDVNFDQSESYLGDPAKALNIVMRMGGDWNKRIDDLMNHEESEVKEIMSAVESRISTMIDMDDWNGAIDSILRLQTTYNLQAMDIAFGKLAKNSVSEKIPTKNCYHIGNRAYDLRKFAIAAQWFETAIYMMENNQDFDNGCLMKDSEVTLEILYDVLSFAYGRQGLYRKAKAALEEVLRKNPSNQQAEKNYQFYVDELDKGIGTKDEIIRVKRDLNVYEQENSNYEALCRDENLFEKPKDKHLICRYYVPHPFFKYQPIKEEVLYDDPRIVYWYDILSDEEIEGIQELAKPRLRRATVKNPVTGVLEFADYRISKSAWLPTKLTELTKRINNRIEVMTGLSIETAEDLQVVNYGMGGHYAPHFDFGRKREKDAFEAEFGNRIATLIYYMSDVEAGGLTAFNRIGAKVKPKKGGAAFWYNLQPSGEGDLRTRHAACPVILGSKWVMNKWFHERGQEFRRRCTLEPGIAETEDGF